MYNLKLSGLYIEITSYCNRNCPYCYNDSTHDGTWMSKEILFKIFDECISHNLHTISLSGGEPFSHPNIEDILMKIDALSIKATIITNLSFLSIERAKKILSNGHKLQITLDSLDNKINDLTRGVGSYRLVCDLLESCQDSNLIRNIILRYNIGKNNFSEIRNIVVFAKSHNVQHLDLSLLFSSGRGIDYPMVFDYKKDIIEISALLNSLKETKESFESDNLSISFTHLDRQLGCVLYDEGDLNIGPKIEPNGDVHICQLFSGAENVLGNISKSTLSEILISDKARAVVDNIRKRKKHNNDCSKCAFNEMCMCGCPAVSYNQTGSLYEKDDQCSLIKYFMKERIKSLGQF